MQRNIMGFDIYIPMDALKTSRRIEVRILRQYLQVCDGDLMCDIGCGYGYWCEVIAGPSKTIGIDIDRKALGIARKQHISAHTSFAASSAEALPFVDSSFDKMFGVCSIEHIPDDTAAFKEFHRCLKPGGVLAITVDSCNYHTIPEKRRRRHAERYSVAHFYDAPGLTAILDKTGFQVTHHRYIIASRMADYFNNLADWRPRLAYLMFPLMYPLTLLSDHWFGANDQGWKLAIRAVKR